MSFGANFALAIKKAVGGWNPAKHPRGRDGKFIEVGDEVKVFSGPSSPQIDTGVVVGGHLYEDGRFFVAVKSKSTGKLAWYRPKQIETMHPKADLTPKMPLPDPGNKDVEHVSWENEDLKGLKNGFDELDKAYGDDDQVKGFAAISNAKELLDNDTLDDALGTVIAEVYGKQVIGHEEKENYGEPLWSPPTTDKPEVMPLISPDGAAWQALIDGHNTWQDAADVIGVDEDPGFAFSKDGTQVVVYDLQKATFSMGEIYNTQMSFGDEDMAKALSPVVEELSAAYDKIVAAEIAKAKAAEAVKLAQEKANAAKAASQAVPESFYVGDKVQAGDVKGLTLVKNLGGGSVQVEDMVGNKFTYKLSQLQKADGEHDWIVPGAKVKFEDGTEATVVGKHMPDTSKVSVEFADGSVGVWDAADLEEAVAQKPLAVGDKVYVDLATGTAKGKIVKPDNGEGWVEVQIDDEEGTKVAFETSVVFPAAPDPEPVAVAPGVAPIKLPAGQTPADVINMIRVSAINKGLDHASVSAVGANIDAALNEPDFPQALKYLATAMTVAKLGGKQRARYKTLLAMHHGKAIETPGSKPGAVQMPPVSTHLPPMKNGMGPILAEKPAGAVVPSQGDTNSFVQGTGNPGGAKGAIQVELAKRLAHVPDSEWAKVIWDSPGHGSSGYTQMQALFNAGGKKPIPGLTDPILFKDWNGTWHIKERGIAGGHEKIEVTPENVGRAIREVAVSALIQTWAATSNDNNVRSLTMQEAAKEEFDLPADWIYNWHSMPQQMDEHRNAHMSTYRAFLRAQYDWTQEEFKKKGWTHLKLRRGVSSAPKLVEPKDGKSVLSGAKGTKGSIIQRPLSSTAAHGTTVNKFGSYQTEMLVPVDRIVGSALTGFGCQNEYEYVIIGGTNEVYIYKNG